MTAKTTAKKTETSSPAPKLEANPFQHEILELVSKQRTNALKAKYLQEYRNDALVSLLIWNFDESVISILPEGEVPYSKVDDITSGNDTLSKSIEKQIGSSSIDQEFIRNQRTSLRKECENFHLFVKGGNDSLSKIKRESIFIQMLEGLHPLEAELICLVKDKKLSTKYKVTLDLVKVAYPDIQWGGRS
jgi:hypothetical protein